WAGSAPPGCTVAAPPSALPRRLPLVLDRWPCPPSRWRESPRIPRFCNLGRSRGKDPWWPSLQRLPSPLAPSSPSSPSTFP
ncbi:hypothetical protein PENTCL1PPCAC_9490, partial [Pristionchus entomophagus]